MANGIKSLIGEEVAVYTDQPEDIGGVLKSVDEVGILISGVFNEQTIGMFVPWSRIVFIRTSGEYEEPEPRVRSIEY